MKRGGLVMLMLVLVCGLASAQFRAAASAKRSGPADDQSALSRFYFAGGGSFGAGTSAYGRYSYYSLLPIVGYKFTPQVMGGIVVTYQHQGFPDLGQSFSQYGVGPFLRYSLNQLFFQAEYDYISSPTISSAGSQSTLENHKFFNRFLLGVGYRIPVGRRSAINPMVMYDVLYRTPSVFNSPVVARVTFSY